MSTLEEIKLSDVQQDMEVPTYAMTGGDGQHSYIHNSSYQKTRADDAQENIRQSILKNLDFFLNSNLSTFRIADFGCSTGPNTFHTVQTIIDTVRFKQSKDNNKTRLIPLEFQVFFNDLPNNDFNTLFRTQPLSSEKEYMLAGVPGSFYDRVLPKNSIHIGYTSYTIQWLSKLPKHVSLALNKNYIQCNGSLEEVTKVFRAQFIKDMQVFLQVRAEEIVHGGLMIVLGQCLADGVPMYETWQGIVVDTIATCLIDMAKMGIISEEKIELFNLPVYFPQFSELKRELEKNQSFTIEMMDTISHPLESVLSNDFVIAMFRAILGTIIHEHFGEGIVNEVFDRVAKKLTKYPINFEECKKHVDYLILLKRK